MEINKDTLTIAVPKGRILKETVELFKKADIDLSPALSSDRSLIVDMIDANMRLMILRSQDVPTYVEYGAADLGVAGKDVLLENGKDLYEPLDLKIGYCRMVVAEPKELSETDDPSKWTHIRVGTKYPTLTISHFMERGIQVEIIKLYGSIEIAPILGLTERIVDLVETGETLKQNGLVEVEQIMEISAKLVVNRASLKTKPKRIKELVEKLSKVI